MSGEESGASFREAVRADASSGSKIAWLGHPSTQPVRARRRIVEIKRLRDRLS